MPLKIALKRLSCPNLGLFRAKFKAVEQGSIWANFALFGKMRLSSEKSTLYGFLVILHFSSNPLFCSVFLRFFACFWAKKCLTIEMAVCYG